MKYIFFILSLAWALPGGLVAQTVQTFTQSGTFTPSMSGKVTVLVVGGGGGGGSGGGGGGGFAQREFDVTSGQPVSVTVGAGGAGGGNYNGLVGEGGDGGSSSFGSFVVNGGGGGGGFRGAGRSGANSGGSGGDTAAPSGAATQGNRGADGAANDGYVAGGGGGGAGGAGTRGLWGADGYGHATSNSPGGNGGHGWESAISTRWQLPAKWYSGGGGGGANNNTTSLAAIGGTPGNGGGGAGSRGDRGRGGDGQPNTGGGGGGGDPEGLGGNGGSGVVIVISSTVPGPTDGVTTPENPSEPAYTQQPIINGKKTLSFRQLASGKESFSGVKVLEIVGVPGLPTILVNNPSSNSEGLLTDGTGSVHWNKWGGLAIKDAEVKKGSNGEPDQLSLAVRGMLPTKNFLQKESGDPIEAEFTLNIVETGVALTGFTVTIPEARVPGRALSVKDITITYNPPEIGLGAVFRLGQGKGIGGSFSLYEGQFNGLSLKGTDLGWKLGQTGSEIDKLDVGFGGIADPPWYIDGGFTVVVGPSRVAGRWPLEVEARGRFYSDYRINLNGNGSIAGIPVGSAWLTYVPSFNIDAGAQIDLLSIIIGSASIQARYTSVGGSISARIQVPYYVPFIGNWSLGHAYAYYLFEPPNWEAAGNVGVNVTPEIPSYCSPWICFPCIPYCYPCGWSWCNSSWCPPCVPPICTPYIPGLSINFGFKVRNSQFSFSTFPLDESGEFNNVTDYVQYPNPNAEVWSASSWEKPWRPVAYDPEGIYEIVWLTNYRQIGKVSTTPSDSLTQPMNVTTISDPTRGNAKGGPVRFLSTGKVLVPEGSPEILVRMHWGTNDVFSESDLAFTITLPSGKRIPLEDDSTLAELENEGLTVLTEFSATERSTWMLIEDAPEGEYLVNVESPRKFTELVFDLVREDEAGVVDIDEPYIDPDDGELVVWWYDLDIDSNAKVTISLAQDRDDDQGFEIFKTSEDDLGDEMLLNTAQDDFDSLLIEADDRESITDDENSADGLAEGEVGFDGWQYVSISPDEIDAPPGDYYVMATISDGLGQPVRKVSATTVSINQTKTFKLNSNRKITYQPKNNGQGAFLAQELPAQVTGVRSRPESDGFSIQWKPVTNSLVTGYSVQYSTNSIPGLFEKSQAVQADKVEARISGLIPGMPYLVRVSAVGADGQTGSPSEVMTIVPTIGFGRTPPIFRSKAGVVAYPGLLYTYYSKLFDGDLLHLNSTNHLNHSTNGVPLPDVAAGYKYVLLAAPEGMKIDPSGIVLWTPTTNQIGTNIFILHAYEVNADAVGDPAIARTLRISQTNEVVVVNPDATTTKIPTPGNRFFAPVGSRAKGAKKDPPSGKNFNGIDSLVFRFLSTPPAYVKESENLDFTIIHSAAAENVELTLLQGPIGMELKETNHLIWKVPVGAKSSKVVVQASVVPVKGAKPQEFVFDFFLPVHRIDNQMSSPAQVLIDTSGPSTKLSIFSRNADPTALPKAYRLQVKSDLAADWMDLMDVSVDREAAMKSMEIPVNTVTLPSLPYSSAASFYRVVNID